MLEHHKGRGTPCETCTNSTAHLMPYFGGIYRPIAKAIIWIVAAGALIVGLIVVSTHSGMYF
jgi:hypothetical protein